jgi:hypothetical protein
VRLLPSLFNSQALGSDGLHDAVSQIQVGVITADVAVVQAIGATVEMAHLGDHLLIGLVPRRIFLPIDPVPQAAQLRFVLPAEAELADKLVVVRTKAGSGP